jgi:putative hydrolase of the HAD superfamily
MSMIGAVLFDLYDTLITESGLHPTRASSLATVLGLDDEAYRIEWKNRRPSVIRGELSLADALAGISQSLAGRADIAAIDGIRQRRMREKAAAFARVDADVAALVAALADRGIGLAVVSNGFEEDVFGWSLCSLAPHFDCTVFSYAEGIAKPDPEMYLRTVRRLGVEPGAAVYIGDGADNELLGAEQAGLRAGRAAWFVAEAPQAATWAELKTPEDVLAFLRAG